MDLVHPGLAHFQDRLYCLSCDIGQSQDPTAAAVTEKVVHTHVTVNNKVVKQWVEFNVVHLERLPLLLDYTQQVEHLHQIYARPPLHGSCALVIDDTGVGRAVGDMFVAYGMRPLRVSITAGDYQSVQQSNRWNVSKGLLVSILDAKLHSGELKIADKLRDASALKEELSTFERSISAAGRFTYSARVGKHDDLVLAVALGLWNYVGRKQPPPAQVFQARLTTL
jgi:hypothetical protein